MSKARQSARAERDAATAARAETLRAEQTRTAERRRRLERRQLMWRRMRLWQHGPGFRREQWGVLGTVVLLVLLVVFVATRSWSAVLGAALICVIVVPVLAVLGVGRRP